jgi:hypothetical protein
VTLATSGIRGGCTFSRRRVATSGTAAGATIEVWKAWLTGMRVACMPAWLNASMAELTATVAPPITACEFELMLATTT